MGTVLTNKYAEGLPNKRYYGGCEHVDVVEELARERAKALFNADHANVQPHAGAQANLAAFMAFLDAGDRILGMKLSHGGHLTHGSPVNISGNLFEVGAYGVGEDGRIDYDALRDQAVAEKPKLIIAGASAYPRVIDFEVFSDIAKEVGAILLVDIRMLGFGLKDQSIQELADHVRPWLIAGVAVMLSSGVLMFLSEAIKCFYNTSFWVKMITLPIALIFTFGVRSRLLDGLDTSARSRVLGAVSIALWFTVAAAGRWIGYS